MLGEEDSTECSQVVPPLILPVVVEEVVVVSEKECSEEPSLILPPPPGFSPFIWPVDDGGMDVGDLCAQISGDCSLILSPISRESSDLWDTTDSPEVGVLISPLEDSSSSRMIDNCLGQRVYPRMEVAVGALGTRIRRAAVQMEGMGLWRPSWDPLLLH